MKTLNKKIYLLIGLLLVISFPLSNIASATCPLGFDEQINPTISITDVSVTDGIVTIGVSFTAGTRIYRDKDGNITTICYGEIAEVSLDIYRSDGSKCGSIAAPIDHLYSGSDTLQWISPSFERDTYTIKAYAWDGGLSHDFSTIKSAPATATVFVDNPLRIISPADGSNVWGVVDITCEFICPRGLKELCLEVWDGHYPLPKLVREISTTGPYPTSGTYTFHWNTWRFPEGAYNFVVRAKDLYSSWGRSDPITVILVKPLEWRAAELAEQVIGVPYQWGKKGYDFSSQRFLAPKAIRGLDCSGLILWAYNRAYYEDMQIAWEEAVVTQNCVDAQGWARCISGRKSPIYCEGAGEQRTYNSYLILREELAVGDLIFLPRTPPVTNYNHIAMYIGDGKIIHAYYPAGAVVREDLTALEGRYSEIDMEYRRIKKPSLLVEGRSPIDLVVKDPNGLIISKELCQAPGSEYVEYDVNNAVTETHDIIIVSDKKIGDYLIEVVPEPNALPTDTYTLEAIIEGQIMVMAQDVQIQDIPAEPYIVESKLCYSDFDSDGNVDFVDFSIFSSAWLTKPVDAAWNPDCDIRVPADNSVDMLDLAVFADHWLVVVVP